MKDENYILVQGWMINLLHLKWNELLLYAIIYWFSQDWQKCRASITYINDALWVTNKTSVALIKKLINKNLIEKKEDKQGNLYTAKVVEKVHWGSGKSTLPGSGKSTPNNNTSNNTIIIQEANEIFQFYRENINLPVKWQNKSDSINRLKKLLKKENKDFILKCINGYFSSTEKTYRIRLNKLINLNSEKWVYYKDFEDVEIVVKKEANVINF